jgi:transposase-like protein
MGSLARKRVNIRNLVLDARYEKVREEGMIRSRAVLVATGINGYGRASIRLGNRIFGIASDH